MLGKEEFGELVSRSLAQIEGVALATTPEGFDTIADTEYLTRLYRTMFGMGARQVLSTLAYHRTRLGKVYFNTADEAACALSSRFSPIYAATPPASSLSRAPSRSSTPQTPPFRPASKKSTVGSRKTARASKTPAASSLMSCFRQTA